MTRHSANQIPFELEIRFVPLVLNRQAEGEMSIRELDGLDGPLTPNSPNETSCEFAGFAGYLEPRWVFAAVGFLDCHVPAADDLAIRY